MMAYKGDVTIFLVMYMGYGGEYMVHYEAFWNESDAEKCLLVKYRDVGYIEEVNLKEKK